MYIEYEATFINIDKKNIRKRLKELKANLVKKEFLQKRAVFNLPRGHSINGAWLRVRDEGDKITMSLKIVDGDKIEDQKEIQLKVDNFFEAKNFLKSIGCQEKAYQENKRELWNIDGVEVTIDEWPFLEPFVEIEAKSEWEVKKVAEEIGFDYNKAKFCSIDLLYQEKYNISSDIINNQTPEILFEIENPFLK